MKLQKMNLADIHGLLDTNEKDITITIRPSGLQEFAINPLSWACKQILGVTFSGSTATLLGTAFHAAIHSFLTGKNERQSLIQAIMAIKDGWKFIPESKRDKSQREIYLLVKQYFLANYLSYAKNIKGKVVVSEHNMQFSLADDIVCTGTTDHIIEENGELIVCDIKTSAISFSTKNVKFDGADLIQERDKLLKELELKKTKEDKRILIQKQLDEIAPLADKLQADYDLACYTECVKQAKAKYGIQLAVYAMLYEATTGKKINKARVELLIKTKIPKFETYEFELVDFKQYADYQLDIIIESINAWRKGLSSKLLFNYNNSTFFGEELGEILGY
ncbi:PD-(D/E)XK nuclease superfamily [Campylobacter hyointestinalis subsp. hyointestinalis]|uniref:PD-(D/E)XK nuclease superfamily n=1 Tax=Campylobacter hyointestinalis subsp. hyointestinalis TaxID=91352 RepID=A0A0S4SUN1_CAMHY|nr:PD-(D/E)XK nuclease family protein [Campylobacter hyointestinalis]CUU89704.1 PD-(D/E)XK nuclease superfamily [Campylobacter hyointestinalis subsp. hyointestinalis]